MTASPSQKLKDLIADFDVAMVVTHAEDARLHSRPMRIAGVDPDGDMWFMTDRHSGKCDEIGRDGDVNIVMQDGQKFVSLSGRATRVEDPTKVNELWTEPMRVWFPGGKEDPNLTLLRVQPKGGEFWDASGLKGIAYLFKAGAAYLKGEKPADDDVRDHGKVKLQ